MMTTSAASMHFLQDLCVLWCTGCKNSAPYGVQCAFCWNKEQLEASARPPAKKCNECQLAWLGVAVPSEPSFPPRDERCYQCRLKDQ